jgi:hypothetical protein
MTISNANPFQALQDAQAICAQTLLNNTCAKSGNFGAQKSGGGINPADDSSNSVSAPSATNPVGDSNDTPANATAQACGLMAYLALLTQEDINYLAKNGSPDTDAETEIQNTIATLQSLEGTITDATILKDVQSALALYTKDGIGQTFNNDYKGFWTPSTGTSPLEDALNWMQTNNFNPAGGNVSPDVGFALSMLLLSTALTPDGQLGNYGDLLNWISNSSGLGAGVPAYLEQFLFLYADVNTPPGMSAQNFRELIARILPPAQSSTDAYGQFLTQFQNDAANYVPMEWLNPNDPQPIPADEWSEFLNSYWSSFLGPYFPN